MGFSFGYVGEIDAEVALGSFIMMIAFLVGFDHLTGVLEWSLEDVPIYNHMLQHIYKEIMIMGVVSFGIGMYQTSDEAQEADNQEWIVGVDFAHYILFYMAFFFVMHAFYLIFLAMTTAKAFDKYHAMPIAMVRDLVPLDYGWANTFLFNHSPISKVREKFEYKVIYVLFRGTYEWVALDFDFARYLTGCMQHYALKVMSAGSFSWLVILVLIVINYARIKLGGDSYLNCGPNKFVSPYSYYNATDDGDQHRMLDIDSEYDAVAGGSEYSDLETGRLLAAATTSTEVTDECNVKALRAFFLCGVILCAVVLIFLFVSRVYLARLIRKSGCESPDDYSNFLAIEEETIAQERREIRKREESNGKPPADSFRSDAEASSFRMAEIRQQRLSGTNGGRRSSVAGSNLPGSRSRRMSLGSAARSIEELKKKVVSEEEEMYQNLSNCVSSCKRAVKNGFENLADWFENGWMYLFRREAYNRMVQKKRALANGGTQTISRSSLFNKRVAPDEISVANSVIDDTARSEEKGRARKSVFKPRATVFPLNTPDQSSNTIAKFRMRKLANGSGISGASPRKRSVSPHGEKTAGGDQKSDINQSQDFSDIYLWESPELFFTLFPVVLIMPCLGQIVKTASLLSAISELDLNVMATVFEDTQDRMTLLKLLRERILERIDSSDETNNTPELVVANLFAEIDTDDNGELSKKEFNLLFTLLDLNYSDEKFNHLYKTIDVNKDGSISKRELCEMVFPELNVRVLEESSKLLCSDSVQNSNADLEEDDNRGAKNAVRSPSSVLGSTRRAIAGSGGMCFDEDGSDFIEELL